MNGYITQGLALAQSGLVHFPIDQIPTTTRKPKALASSSSGDSSHTGDSHSLILISLGTMTHKLPPNLLALFAARPALRYLPPSDHAPEERTTNNIGGVAQYLEAIQDYKETVPYEATESWLQRKDRLKQEKKERQENLLTEGLSQSMRCHFPGFLRI